jgi:hypothetical protein
MIPKSLPPDFWLRNATAPATLLDRRGLTDAEGLARFDLRITDGRIAALAPAGTAPEGIDVDRGQVWPCFVDGHVHLDKTQTWPRQPNPDGTHTGAKNAVMADRGKHYSEADIERASSLACVALMRTAPRRSARISTVTGRTPRRTGQCFVGCEMNGPAGSTCRRSASVPWNVLPAKMGSHWPTRWRDPGASWA